jgi:hypothetical protein
MVCYQVLVRFTFIRHKAALVSTRTKKQKARPYLILSGLPFGSVLKYRRFFRTQKEAARYIAHLRRVYKNRMAPKTPLSGGQQYLF